jgi:hypothetical protein
VLPWSHPVWDKEGTASQNYQKIIKMYHWMLKKSAMSSTKILYIGLQNIDIAMHFIRWDSNWGSISREGTIQSQRVYRAWNMVMLEKGVTILSQATMSHEIINGIIDIFGQLWAVNGITC